MSYILDALNKSEQERRGQQTPDLQTVHRTPPPKSESKFPVAPIVLIFALINIAGLGYWLFSSQQDEAAALTAPPASEQSQNRAAQTTKVTTSEPVQSGLTQPISKQPVSAPPAVSTDQVAQSQLDIAPQDTLITPDSAFTKPSAEAVRITELPINVQRQIPDLVFSSHLYSDEPSFRMVNINGKMRREGDMVESDLKLLEISDQGVILGYRHYVFEVSVLRDWSFN